MNENSVEYKEIPLLQCPFCGSNDIVSRRGNQQRMCMGCGAEGPEAMSRQGADALWNRRAPEPGTSVIRWTRYDGTPETLPDAGKDCIVFRDGDRYYAHFDFVKWKTQGRKSWIDNDQPKVGDEWAYTPTPEAAQ